MPSSALQSLEALESALFTLKQQTSVSPNPLHNSQLIAAARAVSLAADDAEFAATESSDAAFRKTLNDQVSLARVAASNARFQARNAALNVKRQDLLSSADLPLDKKDDNEMTEATRIAAQINDGLRRATAIVSEEINRSKATANVLDHSSKRLRSTRDQHKSYGSSLQSGSRTLSQLKRSEKMANIAIVVCVILFFWAAGHIAKKRITDGNVANFVVKPIFKTFTAPFRIVSGISGISGRSPPSVHRKSDRVIEGNDASYKNIPKEKRNFDKKKAPEQDDEIQLDEALSDISEGDNEKKKDEINNKQDGQREGRVPNPAVDMDSKIEKSRNKRIESENNVDMKDTISDISDSDVDSSDHFEDDTKDDTKANQEEKSIAQEEL